MMLTSGDRPGDSLAAAQLGVATYLMKPVKQSELFDAIVAGAVATHGRMAAARARPTQRQTLPTAADSCLAEDSLVNQKLAVGLLERWGQRVTVANNGREAVADGRESSRSTWC